MTAIQISLDQTVGCRTAGIRLRADAAASFDLVSDELHRVYGWRLAPTDGWRSFAIQQKIFLERYEARTVGYGPYGDVRYWSGVRYVRVRGAAAAVPGTSNHGGGIAIDAGAGVNSYGTRWNQFAEIATARGWSHSEGRSVNEPWHWVYIGNGTFPITPGPLLKVDGLLGFASITRWQGIMGTPTDGLISTPKSSLVFAVQKSLKERGIVGYNGQPLVVDGKGVYSNVKGRTPKTNTNGALQRYLGTCVDGYFDKPSHGIKALQIQLNSGRF